MNASRTNLRRLLCLFVLVMMDVHLQATMLVVIKTPEGYWIGADSARENQGKRVETVCKVHVTSFGVLLKAGNSQGITRTGHSYSIDREIKRLLAASRSADEFKAKATEKFERDITDEFLYLINDPSITPETMGTPLLSLPTRDLFVELDAARGTFETRHQGRHWRRIVGRAHE